jgi:hypothetical protein
VLVCEDHIFGGLCFADGGEMRKEGGKEEVIVKASENQSDKTLFPLHV